MRCDCLADLRVQVEPGPGVVAVSGGVMLVVPTFDPGQRPALEALLDAAATSPVVRGVARVLADFDEDQVPGFSLVADGAQGLFALVHGEVTLSVVGGDGQQAQLSGREARSWVDRALPADLRSLTVSAPGASLSAGDPYSDLRAGLVRGRGVQVTPRATGSIRSPGNLPHPRPEEFHQVDRGAADGSFGSNRSEADAGRSAFPLGPVPVAPLASAEPLPPPDDAPGLLRGQPPADDPLGSGFRSEGFHPEPIRFGDDGRIEPLSTPSTSDSSPAVNGWHGDAPLPPAPWSDPVGSTPERQPAPSPGSAVRDRVEHTAFDLTPVEAPVRQEPPVSREHPPAPQAPLPPLAPPPIAPPPVPASPPPPPEGASFNSLLAPPVPADPFPATRGRAQAQPEASLAGPVRPSRAARGRLVMDNGPDVLVDQDCVIGRSPEGDPEVVQGRARPIVLPDVEQRISRVHARLVVTDGGVQIIDAGSVNGTWIEPPGGTGWVSMVPMVPAPLPLGSRVQVGDIVLSFIPAPDEG